MGDNRTTVSTRITVAEVMVDDTTGAVSTAGDNTGNEVTEEYRPAGRSTLIPEEPTQRMADALPPPPQRAPAAPDASETSPWRILLMVFLSAWAASATIVAAHFHDTSGRYQNALFSSQSDVRHLNHVVAEQDVRIRRQDGLIQTLRGTTSFCNEQSDYIEEMQIENIDLRAIHDELLTSLFMSPTLPARSHPIVQPSGYPDAYWQTKLREASTLDRPATEKEPRAHFIRLWRGQ